MQFGPEEASRDHAGGFLANALLALAEASRGYPEGRMAAKRRLRGQAASPASPQAYDDE